MDAERESDFIKTFFVECKQSRAIHELSSLSKRKDFLWRLSNYSVLLKPQYLIKIPKPNSDPESLQELLLNHGAEKICYCISLTSDMDGTYVDLLDALKDIVGNGMPAFLSCVKGKLAYYEGEQCAGPPDRFILKVGKTDK